MNLLDFVARHYDKGEAERGKSSPVYFQRPHHGVPYYFGQQGQLREFGNHDPRITADDITAEDWYEVRFTKIEPIPLP